MVPAQSFAPLSRPDARVLILGSLPGARSLAEGQYYAHPRNAFWPIMEALTGMSATASYQARTEALVAARIALWDVCAQAVRPGSLDANIAVPSVQANDLNTFLRAHPNVSLIGLNGETAHRLYRKLVKPLLVSPFGSINAVCLPSTSPAHASRSLDEKRRVWCATLRPALAR